MIQGLKVDDAMTAIRSINFHTIGEKDLNRSEEGLSLNLNFGKHVHLKNSTEVTKPLRQLQRNVVLFQSISLHKCFVFRMNLLPMRDYDVLPLHCKASEIQLWSFLSPLSSPVTKVCKQATSD